MADYQQVYELGGKFKIDLSSRQLSLSLSYQIWEAMHENGCAYTIKRIFLQTNNQLKALEVMYRT